MLAAVVGVGCGSTPTSSSSNPAVAEGAARVLQVNEMTAALAGVWERTLTGGEEERLTLFASNTMALQRSAASPISGTVGRWFVRDGALELDVASCEGACGKPALGGTLTVRHSGDLLHLGGGGEQMTWKRVPHPYGTSAGARGRELRDEINWTYKLGIAVGKAQAAGTTAVTGSEME